MFVLDKEIHKIPTKSHSSSVIHIILSCNENTYYFCVYILIAADFIDAVLQVSGEQKYSAATELN